jgi:hypothetical protein
MKTRFDGDGCHKTAAVVVVVPLKRQREKGNDKIQASKDKRQSGDTWR